MPNNIRIDALTALSELKRRHPKPEPDPLAGVHWKEWNRQMFPATFTADYAPHQEHYWTWLDQIGEARPTPFEAMWPRGHAKSTAGEVGIVRLAVKRLRKYWLYVSGTQLQADDHLDSIKALLESDGIQKNYPHLANPKVGLHGNQRAYNRRRLWTPGLIVDAVGLDSDRRGAKLEEDRPDGLALDDVDDQKDSPDTVKRKIGIITRALIPALQENAVIMLLNNLVHSNSIVAQLLSGELDMLSGAIQSGPLPAIEDLDYDRVENEEGKKVWRITKGTPTWSGFGIAQCEATMNDAGLYAFTTESQQKIDQAKGALLTRQIFDRYRWEQAPPLETIGVGVDPNKTGRADDAGIVVAGVAYIEGVLHAFILDDLTQTTAPEEWRDDAARAYIRWNAGLFVVERTGLGQHSVLTLKDSPVLGRRPVAIEPVDAKLSKSDRARPIAQLYRDGRVHHVGRMVKLEDQWATWVPTGGLSPGAIDACVHLLTKLMIDDPPPKPWTPDDDWQNQQDDGSWGIRP